jgi:hypothetical protein
MAIVVSLSLVILVLLFIIFRKRGTKVANPPVVTDPPVADLPVVADPPVANLPVVADPPVADLPVVADPPVVPPVLSIIYNNAVIPFEQTECPICLNDFENLEELIQISSCRHVFHRDCMDAYLENGPLVCPCCRVSIF